MEAPACSTHTHVWSASHSHQVRLLALVGEPRDPDLARLEQLGEGGAVRLEEGLELELELLGQLWC